MPAALLLESHEPLDRRTSDHRERGTLLNIERFAIPRTEQRSAHRTRPFALRTEHVAVGHERLLVGEQFLECHWPALALETILLGDLTARRQGPTLFRDALEMSSEFDLFGE